MFWNKPVRVAIRLPSSESPEWLSLSNPFPELSTVWARHQHEWAWTVPSADAIPDLESIVDMAAKYAELETT